MENNIGDPLVLPSGPITRSRAKRYRAAMSSYVQNQVSQELHDQVFNKCSGELEGTTRLLLLSEASHSSDEDFLESLGISLDIDLTADADTHASVTGIYARTWAFEYFPYTRSELIRADHGLGLVPLAWRCISYHTPDGTLAFQEVSLANVNRWNLPSDSINEVPDSLVSQMMELILEMEQELSSAWTLRAFDDQRRRRPRR
ncbi:hypothetical protein JCGZ_13809 [Jatropha curcas]|uniref:Uncharacterized protein n=1 Tax=Jatropha curcas TaxID=180498 RepID=A0A067K801_JATCU|nr:hypothetical protein JCGZ_13809 [Jatropha curcas]